MIPEGALPFVALVMAASAQYFGAPAPAPVVLAQIMQESAFDPAARSRVGASGLMQFMPATAKWASQAGGFGAAAPLEPAWAIRAGVWYDRWLYDRVRYPSDCHKWGAALSAYNGGLGWHHKRQALADDPADFWRSVRGINPGIADANQRENESYPVRIIYKHQERFRRLPGTRMVCP